MTDAAPARSALPLLAVFAAGLALIGALRWATLKVENIEGWTGLPSLAYIALTVLVALRARAPIRWANMGFGTSFRPVSHIALGLAGAAAVVLLGDLLEPVWQQFFGEARDISRFESVSTLTGLLFLLALTWTFAAFGEEFAFRGVLMGGLRTVLGGGAGATLIALLLQATVFGLIHAYQGPAGIVGTFLSGLIFGVVALAARGSLIPAILAHGLANTFSLVSLYLASQ